MKTKVAIATALFWILFFIGGSIYALLANDSLLWALGSEIVESSWFRFLMSSFASPIALVFAIVSYIEITKGEAYVSLLVNCIVALVICAVMIVLNLLLPTISVARTISTALMAAASIVGIVNSVKEIKN